MNNNEDERKKRIAEEDAEDAPYRKHIIKMEESDGGD